MSERAIQSAVMLAASEAGLTVWRNNTAQAWTGEATRLPDGSILIRNPRPLHAGLCRGSSDLIGIRPLVIEPKHVGRTLGQFLAIEVKTPGGRLSDRQRKFLDFVRAKGGVGLVARGPGDVADIEEEAAA